MTTDHADADLLRTDATDEVAEVVRWRDGEAAVLSRRAPHKDTRNEDAALVAPIAGGGALLLAVADGCGGMPAGDEAARRALGALLETSRAAPEGADLAGTVLAGFDAANQAVLDMRAGAGTTLVVAVIAGVEARVFHVGDSLALVAGQRGAVRFQATPHSPTGFGVEAGLLSESEALAHEDRNLLLNVLGTTQMSVDIGPPVRLRARDTVLLASDGLSDNLRTSVIVDAARTGACADAVQRLAASATARMHEDDGHSDDLTLIAFRPTAHRGR